jgi:hypothetical protein
VDGTIASDTARCRQRGRANPQIKPQASRTDQRHPSRGECAADIGEAPRAGATSLRAIAEPLIARASQQQLSARADSVVQVAVNKEISPGRSTTLPQNTVLFLEANAPARPCPGRRQRIKCSALSPAPFLAMRFWALQRTRQLGSLFLLRLKADDEWTTESSVKRHAPSN